MMIFVDKVCIFAMKELYSYTLIFCHIDKNGKTTITIILYENKHIL